MPIGNTSEKLLFMDWKDKALTILDESLRPIPNELNELDWKSLISNKTDRLAQHLSAFSNHKGGGILVFGVNDDASFSPLSRENIEETLKRLGNIAHNNLNIPIVLDHEVMEYRGMPLLFVYIPEHPERPIHLRGKDIYQSFIRSAGQTRKMSESQVRSLIAESIGKTFEGRIALSDVSLDEMLSLLNYKKFYELIKHPVPKDKQLIAQRLSDYKLCKSNKENWDILNLGALLFANQLSDFPNLERYKVTVRKYLGNNNLTLLIEQSGHFGYAVGFEGLIDFIMNITSTEQIGDIRTLIPTYPRIAIREFVANALVHQDLSIDGMQVTIEIFDNRIVITNPGSSLNDVNRLLDLPPRSRNEVLAQTMFMLGICERRGSGVDRAVAAVEEMFLPAVKFTNGESFTRVFMYPKKALSEMSKQEKVSACYQHSCLMYESGESINNQSIRERFELNKNSSSVASRIIADTLEQGLIKIADESIQSKKYASYIPFYG